MERKKKDKEKSKAMTNTKFQPNIHKGVSKSVGGAGINLVECANCREGFDSEQTASAGADWCSDHCRNTSRQEPCPRDCEEC